MLGHHSPGTLSDVREVSLEIAGDPSCVMSATIELTFTDGSREVLQVVFAPAGMTFETWRHHLEALQRHIAKRR